MVEQHSNTFDVFIKFSESIVLQEDMTPLSQLSQGPSSKGIVGTS